MKIEIYSEGTRQLLFTLFDSTKKRKTNAFRVHKHPELELGYITGGSGDYIIENRLRGLGAQVCEIMELCENTVRAEASRHRIRFLVLRLVVGMLRDEGMTIIEVAQSCGFRNLANFNKAFRKITNMTPSDYRASKRKQ